MATANEPPKPEQKPKVDAQTLAYLLKEIENEIKDQHKLGRVGGGFLLMGAIILLVIGGGIANQSEDYSIAAAACILGGYAFMKLF